MMTKLIWDILKKVRFEFNTLGIWKSDFFTIQIFRLDQKDEKNTKVERGWSLQEERFAIDFKSEINHIFLIEYLKNF